MKTLAKCALCAVPLLLTVSCRVKTPEARKDRLAWTQSLNDSIALYGRQLDSVHSEIKMAKEQVDRLAADFDYVSNPRHVEGFYILSGLRNSYPPESTGIIARITEDIRFELIAALSGGVFDRITVKCNGNSACSSTVPHDQAFNYRTGSLNTVCFDCEGSQGVAAFIRDNESGQVTLDFLGGPKPKSIALQQSQKEGISRTWTFYESRKRLTDLQKEIPRLTGRIAACRRILEREDSLQR